MNRHILLLLAFSILCAPPLAAGERYVSNTSTPTAVETVNWTTGVSYTYDGSGNVRQIGEDRFAYDRAGRLEQAQTNGVTRVYQYDAFGNRIACAHEPGKPLQGDCQFGMAVDPETNRVQGIRYDGAGNVETFMGHTYTYDAVNMPVRDAGVGLPREFIYTADDERIATSSGATWDWTIRDLEGSVLRELSSSNGPAGAGSGSWTWKRDYVYRDGRLLASTQVLGDLPVTYHYHLDHLGTPRRITDQHDRTAGFHDYFAFGPEISGGLTEPAATKLQYTGHERDKTGGGEGPDTLDYMHARYYSPMLGRFLTLDPAIASVDLARPQSWNRYAYVMNSPLVFIDPTGAILDFANDQTRDYYNAYIAGLDQNSQDYKNAKQLEQSNITYVLSVGGMEGKKEGEVVFDGTRVILNLDSGGPMEDASINSRLAHEIQHGVQVDEGRIGFGIGPDGNWRALFGDVHDEVEAWNAQARQATDKDYFKGNLRGYVNAKNRALFLSQHGYPGYRNKLNVVSNAPRIPGQAPGSIFRTTSFFYRIPF